jgi:hypothetical protein
MTIEVDTLTETNIDPSVLDNLSSLCADLRSLEREHVECPEGQSFGDHASTLAAARIQLEDCLKGFVFSRYELGKALHSYKQFYVNERAWMSVAALIAQAIGRDERTVRRIVADYEQVEALPEVCVKELQRQNLDPAAAKNRRIAKRLLDKLRSSKSRLRSDRRSTRDEP